MFKFIMMLFLLLLACGPAPREGSEQPADIKPPSALLVQQVIEGPVLGQPLKNPRSVAVAADGSWYLVDNGNHRLILFNAALTPLDQTGGYGFSAGLLNHPAWVTLDNILNLIVADESNHRLVRYDTHLNFVDEIELRDEDDPFKYGRPSGLGVTDYGEVWLADADRDRVAVFDNVGKFSRFVGDFGYSGGQLSRPMEIALDPDGQFVVCDPGNSRLARYDAYGGFLGEISTRTFGSSSSIAVADNLLWVLDAVDGRLACLDRKSGEQLFVAGPILMGERTRLKEPGDVALLNDGRLMIVDSGNDRVLVCRIIYDETD
jgi:DNA-binding beta-propeller fold protein YncE